MTAWTIPQPTASDPGRATGAGLYVFLPRCACGHLAEVHGGQGKARPCSAADPQKCPCKDFAPKEVHDAEHADA